MQCPFCKAWFEPPESGLGLRRFNYQLSSPHSCKRIFGNILNEERTSQPRLRRGMKPKPKLCTT
jgi:hypothetical protein